MSVGVAHRSLDESNTALLGEIRRLVAQQDRHAKWLDELSAKVNQKDTIKTQESSETFLESEPCSPTSPTAKYHATVEDDIDEEGDGVSLSKSLPSQWEMLEKPPSVPLSLSTSLPPTPVPSPTKQTARVHFSNRRPVVLHNKQSDCYFPAKEGVLLSPVDRTWGTLFVDGVATERMRSVLRGLAKYIISEYAPIDSLVIPTDKMYKFYSRYKLQSEAFPFQRLFESTSQSSTRALGFLYYDLGCEYHLVQDPSDPARPFIPALTPKGFIQWQTCLITAFPSYEAQRFSAIAADLALEAVSETGERPERLPRQLSHHLFPSKRDDKSYRDVLEAFAAWKRAMTPSISQGAPAKTYRKESSRHSERDAVVVVPRRGSDPKSYDKRDRSPPRRSSRDLTPEKKSRRYSSGRSPSDRERAKRRDDSDYRKRSR